MNTPSQNSMKITPLTLSEPVAAASDGISFSDVWQSIRLAVWLGMTTPLALALILKPGADFANAYPAAAVLSGIVALVLSIFVKATVTTRDPFIGLLRGIAWLVLGVQFLCFLGALGFLAFAK